MPYQSRYFSYSLCLSALEIICDAPPNGYNTVPVPGDLTLYYLDVYTYACEEGYMTEDELCTVCLPDGSLSIPYPPNCTGK